MSLKINLKSVPSKYINSVTSSLLLYLALTTVLIYNFNRVLSFARNTRENEITEALLYPPSSNISPDKFFSVDPLLSSPESEFFIEIRKNISYLVFSSLFKENITGGVDNELVDNFEFKEGKELRIKIYDNVLWHDGKKLTANDIVFTLNQIKAVGDDSLYYGAVNGGDIDYKVVNDNEIFITLGTAYSAYLHELTFPILPKHKLENYSQSQIKLLYDTEFGKYPVGSGKLELQSNRGDELVLKKNDNYFKEKVKFSNYIYRFYKNYDDIIKDYSLKNIDVFTRRDIYSVDDIHNKFLETGARNSNMTLLNRNYVLYFNINSQTNKNAPFIKSISLRNSLTKIIDRESLNNSLNNLTRPIYGPIDHESWGFLDDVREYQALNKDEFIKKVESMGYKKNAEYYEKDGNKLDLTLTYLEGDVRDKISEELQRILKESGVNVKLNKIGNNISEEKSIENTVQTQQSIVEKFNNIINNRNFEVLLTSVNHFQDPDRFPEWHSSQMEPPGNNLSGFHSTVTDTMLTQGRTEYDQEKRKEKYQRFQRLFIQETPAIYLHNPVVVNYFSPRLQNVNTETVNDYQYKYSNISNWELKQITNRK